MHVVIEQYDKNMLGADKGGQFNSLSGNSRKSMQWFVNVGLELILGACIHNAYILRKINYL